MKKSSRILSASLAVVMLTGILSGCQQNASDSSSQKSDDKSGSEKITLSFMDWESVDMDNAITATMAKFTEENPNVTVEMIPTPLSNYATKLEQMIQSGSAPDVFRVGNNWALQYGAKGVLYDLNEYAKNDADFINEFYPGYVEHFKVGESLYAMPGLINTYGVFYNKTLFDEAKVPYPTNDWTYTDLYNAAEKLKKPAQKTYGLYGGTYDPFFMGLCSVQNGGAGFTDAIYPVTKVTADKTYKEGVAAFSKCIADGAFAPADYDVTNLVSQFASGSIPMMWYGQWAASDIAKNVPDLKWGYVVNPKGSANTDATLYDCTGWSVLKTTKHPEEAYKLSKFIVSKSYEEVLPKFPVAPTAYKPASKAYYSALESMGHKDVGEAVDAMCNAETKVSSKILDTFADRAAACYTKWNSIFTSKTQSEDIDKMIDAINKVIQASK